MRLPCPRCYVDLREAHAQDVVLQVCPQCGGLWLDRQAEARVNEVLSAQALALADAAAQQATRLVDQAPVIHCPVCAEILLRSTVAKTVVIIDRCPEHGVFYDRNELQKIARALGRVRQPPPSPPAAKSDKKSGQKSGNKKESAPPPSTKAPQKPEPKKPEPPKAANPPQKKEPPSPKQTTDSSSGETAVSVAVGIVELIIALI